MVYLVSKVFVDNNLKFSDELISFLQVLEPHALEHYPTDVLSNDFRYLIQGLFFSKEFYEAGIGSGSKLFTKIVDSIRNEYNKLLEGEHRSFNINKICRILSSMEGQHEQALLKEICTIATKGLSTMPFNEFVHTINMVFPYMHREQIALWNRMRNQMQNINPYHS